MNVYKLNKYCLKRVRDYQKLDIYGREVITPYYINIIERHFVLLMRGAKIKRETIEKVRSLYKKRKIPYGWYRGKGTPEEISKATVNISESVGLSLKDSNPEVIQEFMKLYGLGIDCSGFVYNVLEYSLIKAGDSRLLVNILDWTDSITKDVFNAGSRVFAGKASIIINLKDIIPLDLILIRSQKTNRYVHVALILNNEETNQLIVSQSTLTNYPTGVKTNHLKIENNLPLFGYKPEIGLSWEELYHKGNLEFRRLLWKD